VSFLGSRGKWTAAGGNSGGFFAANVPELPLPIALRYDPAGTKKRDREKSRSLSFLFRSSPAYGLIRR
jgi:hypothetical protein